MASLRKSPPLLGVLVAITLHAAIAAALAAVDLSRSKPPQAPLAIEVVEPPPPPPRVEPAPPPRTALPKPRIVAHRHPPPTPASETPPPPPPPVGASQVFGVTSDSVIEGPSEVAVPVGNTLMTKDRAPPKPAAYAATAGPAPFAPVTDSYLAQWPSELKKAEHAYPEEAKRLRIEGQVLLRVGVDRKGNVRVVRTIKKAGYGMDEAASSAMWHYKFTPCRTKDGQAVDCQINYRIVFELPM